MRTRAIVLKKLALREDDELVSCYTEMHGKQRYLMKSSARSDSLQGSHFDILSEVEFSLIEGKRNTIIASGIATHTFHNIKQSLPAFAIASIILEVLDSVVYENQHDIAIWEFLQSRLRCLDQSASASHTSWLDQQVQTEGLLLQVLGYHGLPSLTDILHRPLSSLQFLKHVLK